MVYEVKKKTNFQVEVDIPGSKSITNRAMILAALNEKETLLKNMLFSDDTLYMIDALQKLGNELIVDKEAKTVLIKPNKEKNWGKVELFVGNAGTAMRFLPTYIATGNGEVVLTGIERMKDRPIKDLVDALQGLGVEVEYVERIGFPPIRIKAKGLNGGRISIKGDKSSQYITSILLSAPYAKSPVEIDIIGDLVSIPYVEITKKMMEDFGATFKNDNYKKLTIEPAKYSRDSYIIEGDCSSASYFFAMAAIAKSRVRLNNVTINSIQGDIKFLEVLLNMGLTLIESGENHIVVEGQKDLKGISVDMKHISDTAQTLSVVALFAKGPTEIKNVYNMRIKETDRIKACYNELTKLGAKVIEKEDGLIIYPKENINDYNKNVLIDTYDDHRMAMSFSLAGLLIDNVKIHDPNCVSKTFPNYFEEFGKIYK